MKYEVTVVAVVGVERRMTVEAETPLAARQFAKQLARASQSAEWTFTDSGETITIGPERIADTHLLTGMCPTVAEN